ncbi:MAG: D-glycerate dehydrogenase [Alphaproteobacteria bacterium]|nr:D-glycerate dehydrogenase [Alphaproteobacteria bacterium]
MTRPVVVLTRKWPTQVERVLAERYDLRTCPADTMLASEAILARCGGATVLAPAADRIDGALIAALPGTVRLIAVYGAGFETIDLAAARSRAVMVSNTPDVVTEETADVAFGLIIAAARRFAEGDAMVRDDTWPRGVLHYLLGQRVWGQTLGIVGLGRIGGAVARRAVGFRMPILYHSRRRNPTAEAACGARYCARLGELLAGADIVVLATPGGPETRHLIDAAALAAMKPTSVLINVGRGSVVAEAALIEALAAGRIAAAGLDVHEFEPTVAAELRRLPNTFLLPHLGTATAAARDDMGFRVARNIEAFFATGQPIDRVA